MHPLKKVSDLTRTTACFTKVAKERKRPYYGHFCGKMHRGLVAKRPGVLSRVQMLNLVLGVRVFSLLPIKGGVAVMTKILKFRRVTIHERLQRTFCRIWEHYSVKQGFHQKAFRPDFGAYRGLGWVLFLPPTPQNTDISGKSCKRALLLSAPNLDIHQILVQKRSDFRPIMPTDLSQQSPHLIIANQGRGNLPLRGLCGVSTRVLRGLSEGSAGVRGIFRGFSGVVTLCL